MVDPCFRRDAGIGEEKGYERRLCTSRKKMARFLGAGKRAGIEPRDGLFGVEGLGAGPLCGMRVGETLIRDAVRIASN